MKRILLTGFAVTMMEWISQAAWAAPGDLLFTLMPDMPVAEQDFADALDIDGPYVLVGAEDTMQDGVPTVGAAYLFDAASGAQLRKISLAAPPETRAFGTSVALDGNLMVIGAADENGARGAAYVFDIAGNQLFKLLADGGSPLHEFGDVVAISGNRVVVNAPNAAGPEGAGLAYLFDLTGATPGSTLMAAALPQPADLPSFPDFASALDIDGDRIIFGIDRNGNGGGAYVYDSDGNLLRRLEAPLVPGPIPGPDVPAPGFGRSVAISGSIAIVGATLDENQVVDEIGRAFLFDVETGNMLFELLPDSSQPADLFSDVVDISGNLAIVSQRLEETQPLDPDAVNTGFVFDVTTGQQLLQFPGEGIEKGQEAFEALAIDGGLAVVGLEGVGRALLFDVMFGVLTGDLDCDGDVDFDDIDDFVLGLNNPAAYEALYGMSPTVKGDTDDDDDLDFDDIAGFVNILSGGAQAVPEPATWALASAWIGMALLTRARRRRPLVCASASDSRSGLTLET
jgi:hypothetical protein